MDTINEFPVKKEPDSPSPWAARSADKDPHSTDLSVSGENVCRTKISSFYSYIYWF